MYCTDPAFILGVQHHVGVVDVPLARLMRSQLFVMSPADPLAVGGGIGTLLLAALAARFGPAARATRIDPMLREE